jgi:prepilin-type N-terminal cleavage/methylation domain-containing protein
MIYNFQNFVDSCFERKPLGAGQARESAKVSRLLTRFSRETRGKRSFGNFKSSGFTLAELAVCTAIVAMIAAVALFIYTNFSDSLNLSSAGQELSLEIRQAQTYGLSVKEVTVGSGQFTNGYGIHVSLDDPSDYYIFVDQNGNGKYDGSTTCTPGGECVEKMSFRNSVSITSICGAAFGGGSLVCPPNASVRAMDIIFLRPNPDAQIRFVNSDGSLYSGGGTFQTGQITLTSLGGRTANVVIQNTGQISTQ